MPDTSERSIRSVFRDIGSDVDRIVRAELRIAIAEVRAGVAAAGDASRLLIAGAMCALLAATFLLLAVMFALRSIMPLWLAALLIALLVGVAATGLLLAGRTRLSLGHTARQTGPTLTGIVS